MGKRRFWGSVWGNNHNYNSTEAGRGGTHGVTGHIRGWNSGIKVVGYIDTVLGDCFRVYVTSGSHGGKHDVLIGELVGDEWIPSNPKT